MSAVDFELSGGSALADDSALAAALATDAGRLLLSVRQSGLSGSALKDAGDRQSHDFLMSALADARAGDAVLSEEGVDDPARLSARRVWIVDPLDGTREFSEPGRTDWAVHVALWESGALAAGAVALPALGRTFSTPVVALEGAAAAAPRVVVSRTRPPAVARAVAEALGGTLVEMGSAGAKAMAIVQGFADVYVHAGGQYEWDSAAPVAVAQAAGLHVSRLDGSQLAYNRADPYVPDLVICRPALTAAVLAVTAGG